MPSVEAHYCGRLLDEEAQDRLTERILLIAESIRPALQAEAIQRDEEIRGDVLACAPCVNDLLRLERARIAGAELLVTDFRGDVHRFCFTFVRDLAPADSIAAELLGQLVMVEDSAECDCYLNPRIRAADWFLAPAVHLHLRYHLEPEFDLLMGYVRRFHLPSLHYWRYHALPGWLEFEAWTGNLQPATAEEEALDEVSYQLRQAEHRFRGLLDGER